MKNTFVLDENVIIAASEGSGTAATLLMLIVKNCHHIAVNTGLMQSYRRNLRRRRKSAPLEVPKLVDQLTHHAEKCCFVQESGPDPAPVPLRHQKDVFLVRIAREVGQAPTYVVSMDRKTRDDIKTKTGLKAVTIGEALMHAREVDG
ncbi:MAG: hypothetical protein HYY01_00280 [Chloroflexi bacterium]|nr:hypothetical protein [Chloroflexota bacterium]